MTGWSLAVVAVIIGVYALFSGVLARHWISAAFFFVAAGLVAGDELFGVLEPAKAQEVLLIAAEATLALVLFTDASRLDVGRLRREFALPGRLLGIGLPLTIVAGAALGAALLGKLSAVEALVLAIALAPTDAALGQAVVTDERVPPRVRQGLNVESGLNDGLCVPLLLIALAVAEAHAGTIGEGEALRLVVEEIGWGIVGGVVGRSARRTRAAPRRQTLRADLGADHPAGRCRPRLRVGRRPRGQRFHRCVRRRAGLRRDAARPAEREHALHRGGRRGPRCAHVHPLRCAGARSCALPSRRGTVRLRDPEPDDHPHAARGPRADRHARSAARRSPISAGSARAGWPRSSSR